MIIHLCKTLQQQAIAEKRMTFPNGTFTYNQDYQLIEEGENELTAKITCLVRDAFNGVVDMNLL